MDVLLNNVFCFAVLLTVHNRKNTTVSCLNRLYSISLPSSCKMEVYLTDDGCTDGTTEAVQEKFPSVKIISGDGNLFWNRGMIAAWNEAAKIDYDAYLWLNDDTVLYDDALLSLFDYAKYKKHNSIIIGSCEHENIFTYGGRNFSNIDAIPISGKENEVRNFNGNIVWVPRNVYKKIGTMDPYYRHSWGDVEYGLRASKNGIKSYSVDHYIGDCERHKDYAVWCNPKYPISSRFRALNKPNGLIPREVFHFEKEYIGLFTALFHYFTVYLRCFFPSLWIKSGKVKKII